MNENLNETMKACIGACIPCIAIDTTDTEDIIHEIVTWAVSTGNGRDVYVWRVSVGYEKWGAYVTNDDGTETLIDSVDNLGTVYNIRKCPDQGPELTPDDDMPGMTIPFAIDFIDEYDSGETDRSAIFVLRDWDVHMSNNSLHVDRQLALMESLSSDPGRTIVALSATKWSDENLPRQLSSHVYRMNYSLPNKGERITLARYWQGDANAEGRFPKMQKLTEADIEDVADATGGLTRMQVVDMLCTSISVKQTYDLDYILKGKKRLVEQAGFEISVPAHGFEVIGGLTPLKQWSSLLRKRFTQAAFDYGFLSYPRGLLMAGVPGCGKSAIAKAIANEWGMNMLTVDPQNLKGSLVGESEEKVGTLLRTAKAAAPIILFVDEAEKLLGKSDGVNDGGAHDAVLGQFLSFMQEDTSGVFFVFTANNMEKFAPELVDRFEGRFFIDLPSATEREEILKIHLALRNKDAKDYDMPALVQATKSFSGRNMEDAIDEAMGSPFNEDSRPLTQADLMAVFKVLIPTSKTKKTEIETMRTYVENGMMRKANDQAESTRATKSGKRFASFD
jgi:ATP-dependent 26S proteasome regulatory subunit